MTTEATSVPPDRPIPSDSWSREQWSLWRLSDLRKTLDKDKTEDQVILFRFHGGPISVGDVRRLDDAIAGLRANNATLAQMLRDKDSAMSVLFERLAKHNIDVSDLIP